MPSSTLTKHISPSEFLSTVHQLSYALALARSPADQSAALKEHIRLIDLDPDTPQQETYMLWEEMMDTKLIAKLFAIVARQDFNLDEGFTTIAFSSSILYLDFMARNPPFDALFNQDRDVQELIDIHTPKFCSNTISVHFRVDEGYYETEPIYFALVLFGPWIYLRLHDNKFIPEFDIKAILDFVYHIQFDLQSYFPGVPCDRPPPTTYDEVAMAAHARNTTRHCATLMEVVGITETDAWLPCARKAVWRYGAENVAKRCKTLLLEDAADFDDMHSSRILGLSLVSTVQVHHPMLRTLYQHDIYATMLDRYWDLFTYAAPRVPRPIILEDLAFRTLFYVHRALAYVVRAREIDLLAMYDGLSSNQDFILLWGRVLVQQTTPSSDENGHSLLKNLQELIADYVDQRPHLRADPLLVNQAVHVHRCLSKGEPHLKEELSNPAEPFWRLAYWEGVMQATFMRSHRQLHDAHSTNLVGCSYMGCPLFRDNMVAGKRPMLLCSRCRSEQYCNANCQRSDWRYGGHKVVCTL